MLEPVTDVFLTDTWLGKEPVEGYKYFVLNVIAEELKITGITAVDEAGNKTVFDFSGIRENVDLDNSLFIFSIPQGVEIIEN